MLVAGAESLVAAGSAGVTGVGGGNCVDSAGTTRFLSVLSSVFQSYISFLISQIIILHICNAMSLGMRKG